MASPGSAGAAMEAEAAAALLWERAWSLEEIRGGSQAWSLAADAGLLRYLQEFSQQTISRTHEIKKQMDGLVQETKNTDCRLHNVFNGFLMLSNTQFIENRVYDEEVEESAPRTEVGDKPEQEKTREQKEADLIPKIQEAVNYGLQVLDSAFEQLDIKAGNSDSEEETNEKMELILEPKDLYIDRPLPYLIGSQLFMEQDDVGLGDLSSEGSVDSDRGSMVDSEGKDEEELEEDLGNVSEDDRKPRTALVSDEEDDDLFGGDSEKGEDDDDEMEENSRLKKKRPTSFTDQLAARIKGDLPYKRSEEQLSSAGIKNKKTEKEKEGVGVPSDDDDDIFRPPKLTDEDFSPFASSGGLFSGGMGLFEEDEESDLFAELPKGEDAAEKDERVPINDEPSSKAVRKVPAGAVFLLPGGTDVFSPSSLLTEKEGKKAAAEPVSEKTPKQQAGVSLFDDDDFQVGRRDPVSTKSASDLFGDVEEDLFKEKPDAARPVKDAPKEAEGSKGSVARDKGQPPSAQSFKPSTPTVPKDHKSLFSDEEDSEDLFSSSQPSKNLGLPSKATTKAPLSLFEDEDEEELFGPLPVSAQVSKPPPEKASRLLFSSDEEDHWNPASTVKSVSEGSQKKEATKAAVTVIKKSLFEEEEEEDLFAITKDSQRKPQKAALLFEEDSINGDSLFDFQPSLLPSSVQAEMGKGQIPDSSPPDKQADLPETSQKKQVKEKTRPSVEPAASPLLGPGEDLGEQPKKEKSPLEKDTKKKTKSVFSLFEDEEKVDEVDAGKSIQKDIEKPPEKSARPKSTGVFQDEELLFSHKMQKDNDPDVDLFASNRKGIPKPRGKLPPGGDLFGDDDSEDGLFSSARTKPLKSTGPATSKPKEPSPWIGKLQANLDINPAALLPSEAWKPSAPHPEAPQVRHAQTAPALGKSEEAGVSFDYPMQADTLHSANKGRIKMTKKRRPPTRTARRLAAQRSSENEGSGAEDSAPILSTETSVPPVTLHTKGTNEKVQLLRSTSSSDQPHKTDEGPVSKSTAPPDTDDLFESGDLFEDSGASKATSKPKVNLETENTASQALKKGEGLPASLPSSDSNYEDLFKPAKPSKKSSPVSFLDNQDDLFSSKKPPKRKAAKLAPSSDVAPTVKDIFEDDIFASEAVKLPPVKAKELDANLFDDDVDIFADLAVKPKERSAKKKVEAKSIFDEDMDDIFLPNSQSKSQTKKTQPVQTPSGAKSEPKASSIFEDPLNAFEG